MMHMGNDIPEDSNRAMKRTKKVHGVIQHMEKQFYKYIVPGRHFPVPGCTAGVRVHSEASV
jgi:hypothetical protein